MPVAQDRYFSKEHIEAHKFDVPAALAEQAVYCLELVAELSWSNLPFVFKGGNSLLVVLQDPKRFSIDVDIMTHASATEIESVLDIITKECGSFTKWTKRKHKPDQSCLLTSYYLYYTSHFVKSDDSFIMLDCLLTKNACAAHSMTITCQALYSTVVKAMVATPSSLIGDKLITLCPATLGFPLGKGHEAERIKHVFDVNLLLQTVPDLNDCRNSFTQCIELANTLQSKTITAQELLADILFFCKALLDHAKMPVISPSLSALVLETVKGLPEFAGHLFSKKYVWDDLRCDVARVALLITAVCNVKINQETLVSFLESQGNDPVACWTKSLSWLKSQQ